MVKSKNKIQAKQKDPAQIGQSLRNLDGYKM